MARPLRITYPGAFYHVTARGNEQKAVFKSKSDRIKFLGYLESASVRYNAEIHAYCLMVNHYHLLLETPSGNLPQIMRHINGAYTTYFNTKRARSGHLFQGRYRGILVEKDAYAKELSRYIHLNPVRADMVEKPEDYPWCSYSAYMGKIKAPDWLCRGFILAFFGKKTATAQRRYRDFVETLLGREYESPIAAATGASLLGSTGFVTHIKDCYLCGEDNSRDVPALKQIFAGIAMETVIDLVAKSFGDNQAHQRNAGIYLCRQYTGEKLATIGSRFGISDAAVSQACKRFKARIDSDRKLGKQITAIERKLSKVET